MGLSELILLAVGLSMDAFAVSICKGLSVKKIKPQHVLSVGLYFGGFQALMPLLGYWLASYFQKWVESFDHLISFALLAYIGFNMIKESREKEQEAVCDFSPKSMLLLAVATSIDALAVGITFAFLKVHIFRAVGLIGVTTFLFSAAGLFIGKMFGMKLKAGAEIAGGVILILIGVKILLEHLGILSLPI